jgi:glycosyltransferase involved in cell wall biosynthesis
MYEARFKGRSNALIHRLLLALEKLTFRMADHVVATNESYRQVALERGDKRAQDVTVVRNGPDTGRVRRVEPDLALQARADHIIVYVGVMGFQDGVDYLIRSLNRLVVDLGREDFLCVIVGSGVAVPSLKELAAQLNLDDQVWFTGRISDEDLMRYLSTADICVDPDPFNPFNDRSTMIKMTEYMAMGKPIVAFDLTEHRHTAQEAALYAAANDEMDFAKKLVELMDDPQQRRQMGDFGRSRIDRELAWPHQAERLIAAYDRLTARAGVDDG